MSTLKVDTYLTRGGASEIAIDKLKGVTAAGSMLVVGEGGTNTTNLQQGLAKCWHLHDHAGAAILDSFNVTSFTDQATGHYRTVIASDMASANYVTTGSNIQGDTEYFSCMISDGGVNTATNCDYKIVNMGGSVNDNDIINVVIHGDLA